MDLILFGPPKRRLLCQLAHFYTLRVRKVTESIRKYYAQIVHAALQLYWVGEVYSFFSREMGTILFRGLQSGYIYRPSGSDHRKYMCVHRITVPTCSKIVAQTMSTIVANPVMYLYFPIIPVCS